MKKEEKLQDKNFKHTIICPECGVKLSPYTNEGKHNFCPKSTNNGKITEVCMKCKMKEILALWRSN